MIGVQNVSKINSITDFDVYYGRLRISLLLSTEFDSILP